MKDIILRTFQIVPHITSLGHASFKHTFAGLTKLCIQTIARAMSVPQSNISFSGFKACVRQLYRVIQFSSDQSSIPHSSLGHKCFYLMELCHNLSILSSLISHLCLCKFSQDAFLSLLTVFLGHFQSYLSLFILLRYY